MGKIMMYDTPIAGSVNAAYQAYDNTDSGLAATNVQGAIDEVVTEKTDNTNLGTVELTTTATAAHAVGTYFILGGQFVKTTVAISVGDTITVGTNVTVMDVGSVLTELNSNNYFETSLISKYSVNTANWAYTICHYIINSDIINRRSGTVSIAIAGITTFVVSFAVNSNFDAITAHIVGDVGERASIDTSYKISTDRFRYISQTDNTWNVPS